MKQFGLWLASGALFLALILAGWADANRVETLGLTPTLTGEVEYCLSCHADLPEISPSHPVEAYGCVRCHGGERLALEAELAHSTLRGGANPSDLAVVNESCGGADCHAGSSAAGRDHIQRVSTSIQATYAGAIANIRYSFGAQPDLNAYLGVRAVQDTESMTGITALKVFDPAIETNPMLQRFGENCLTCHLHSAAIAGAEYARFGGCAACHTGWSEAQVHTLTTVMPYTQCNTCHNRGNYDLRTMTFIERSDLPTERVDDYYQPIAQFTRCEYTLDCSDCHTRAEAMGDGDLHASQASMQYVQCKTCHGTLTALPQTKTLTDPNDLAFRLAQLNPVIDLKLGDTILVTAQGEPLWHTRLLADGRFELFGKASQQHFYFHPVMGTNCEQDPSQQDSHYCHACHALER